MFPCPLFIDVCTSSLPCPVVLCVNILPLVFFSGRSGGSSLLLLCGKRAHFPWDSFEVTMPCCMFWCVPLRESLLVFVPFFVFCRRRALPTCPFCVLFVVVLADAVVVLDVSDVILGDVVVVLVDAVVVILLVVLVSLPGFFMSFLCSCTLCSLSVFLHLLVCCVFLVLPFCVVVVIAALVVLCVAGVEVLVLVGTSMFALFSGTVAAILLLMQCRACREAVAVLILELVGLLIVLLVEVVLVAVVLVVVLLSLSVLLVSLLCVCLFFSSAVLLEVVANFGLELVESWGVCAVVVVPACEPVLSLCSMWRSVDTCS